MTQEPLPDFSFPQPKRPQLRHFTYRDLGYPTLIVQLLTLFYALITLLAVARDTNVISALSSGGMSGNFALMQVAGYLAVLLAFLYWLYRATVNCTAQVDYALRYTPVFAAICIFIPALGLFAPYGAVRQIWNVAHDPTSDPTIKVPLLPLVWWGLMLIGVLAPLAAFTGQAMQPPYGTFMLVLDVLTLALCYASYELTRKILVAQRRQQAKMR